MVFVKVRETYDLHTTQNKMTVIAIHTPKPDIIKKNYPGLLMQCKAYRPVSADVRIACASVLPLDPLGVGTAAGDVAPEDVFNPILYKAISNKGMSQLEARIMSQTTTGTGLDVDGNVASVDVDSVTDKADEFGIYYGLLANTHDWKHANPQHGVEMSGLRPLVYEMVYNFGDNQEATSSGVPYVTVPGVDGTAASYQGLAVLGKAKEFPFLNCTAYSDPGSMGGSTIAPGFVTSANNSELNVPWMNVVCGCIIIPPSRLHSLYFRMVCEWTLEFSAIRPLSEITDFNGLSNLGLASHYQNYSYSAAKEALTGSSDSILENDACMVSSTAEINKVM